jgi:hypothetical protein
MNEFTDFTGIIKSQLLTLLLVLLVPGITLAAADMEDLLPPLSCGNGWLIEGKPSIYNRDTLSDRINGEAELYMPYGFDRMAAARYSSKQIPGAGIDVEVYRMGSPVDAFGMYANYRQKDGRNLDIGTESNLSASQLYLYQGLHFVHIQMTGTDVAEPATLSDCAGSVISRLPGERKRPPELTVFTRPEIITGTERYLPQSLLGYDFLNKGLMADAVLAGENLQIFILLGTTPQSSSDAFNGYRSQLAQLKPESQGKTAAFLEGTDPLYGPVIVLKKGDCIAGALKFGSRKGVRSFLENICR